MKNILILANGEMAKHFVQWVNKRRIDDNHYYITCPVCNTPNEKAPVLENFTYIDIDPTSYLRLQEMMNTKIFSMIFIVMNEKEESLCTLRNIRKITARTLVVFVNKWDNLSLDDENITFLNINEIIAGSLYERLPNVPILAKNIGLGQGEIMELLVPFGSSFAHRHIGAISHRKWRIVALYRREKQIFPNNATMILPNDRLIVIGTPMVLEELYKRVNRKQGVFPEPFGKNLYLIIDSADQKREEILLQINEAIFLSNQLTKTKLFIRIIHLGDVKILDEIRKLKTEHIDILVNYNDNNILGDIDCDISGLDIGLFLLHRKVYLNKKIRQHLYALKRPIYIFGDKLLYNIKKALLLMSNEVEMESLSTSVFDFSDTLNLELSLCDYNPEGDFEDGKNVIEHYESLSRLYNFKINIEQKRVNPIRELLRHDEVLYMAPFTNQDSRFSFLDFFSMQLHYLTLKIKKHPQLLIPVNK